MHPRKVFFSGAGTNVLRARNAKRRASMTNVTETAKASVIA